MIVGYVLLKNEFCIILLWLIQFVSLSSLTSTWEGNVIYIGR